MQSPNVAKNVAAMRERGEKIRRAKAEHKQQLVLAGEAYKAATFQSRVQLDAWRKEQVAAIDAEYERALVAANPAAAAAKAGAIEQADAALALAVEAAEREYRHFLVAMKEDARLEEARAEWRANRDLWLNNRLFFDTLADMLAFAQNDIARGVKDETTAYAEVARQAFMYIDMFPEWLQKHGEEQVAQQWVDWARANGVPLVL